MQPAILLKFAERWEISECVWNGILEDWETGRVLKAVERRVFFAQYGPFYEC